MEDGGVPVPRGRRGCTRFVGLVKDSEAARKTDVPGRGRSGAPSSVAKGFDTWFAGFTPFVDEAEAERAAKEERRIQMVRQMAHNRKHRERDREVEARIRDFDPKQGGVYYNRLYFADFSTFDLDEESPYGPIRFTNEVYTSKDDYELCEAINVFSVRIASLDVHFPIHVYGTVIARDSIDRRCVYLFRRDRDHSQTINSEDESLVLTGPKRGLALMSDAYVETDLMIKDHQGHDKELSKGILTIRGMERRELKKCELETESLATRLSTVDVLYSVVKAAVEGTIAIEILQGDFNGKITACTTSIQNSLVLYDSKVSGPVTGNSNGFIQLLQPVVSVRLKEMLLVTIAVGDGQTQRTIEFTPRVNGGDEDQITVGVTNMRVKVTWSIIDF